MQDTAQPDLKIGQRVRIRRDPTFAGPWPAEPLATVVPWPGELSAIDPAISGGELFRIVHHHSGPRRYWGPQRVYFVEFDEPQFDTDGPAGGGPYRKAEVWKRYIEPVADLEVGSAEPAEPVVLVEGNDVNVFASVRGLLGYVEASDVRDGAYEAFDATGRSIVLAAASDRGPVTYTTGPDAAPEGLRAALIRFGKTTPGARALGPAIDLDSVSLEDLLDALAPKKQRRRRWLRR